MSNNAWNQNAVRWGREHPREDTPSHIDEIAVGWDSLEEMLDASQWAQLDDAEDGQ